MTWGPFNDGSSIGTVGSEQGVIRIGEEHSDGARISLEEGGRAPWSITCGIDGSMVHTRFFDKPAEAESALADMKVGLAEVLSSDDPHRFRLFVERFP